MAILERISERPPRVQFQRPTSLIGDSIIISCLFGQAFLDHRVLGERIGPLKRYRSSQRMTLVSTLWRQAAEINLHDFRRSGAYESFCILTQLLNCYDDLIDNGLPGEIVPIKKLKFGFWDNGSMSNMVSDLVSYVSPRNSNNDNNSGTDLKRGLIKRLGEFRRQQYKIYEEYFTKRGGENIDFEGIIRYRSLTSGSVMQIMAATLNAFFPNIDFARAQKIENAFNSLGVSGQFVDDICDWWKDEGQLNLFSSALSNFPQEKVAACNYKRLNPGRILSVAKLRRLAPESTALMTRRFEDIVREIPKGREFDNFRRILRVTYYLLPDMYARTESKPLDVDKVEF